MRKVLLATLLGIMVHGAMANDFPFQESDKSLTDLFPRGVPIQPQFERQLSPCQTGRGARHPQSRSLSSESATHSPSAGSFSGSNARPISPGNSGNLGIMFTVRTHNTSHPSGSSSPSSISDERTISPSQTHRQPATPAKELRSSGTLSPSSFPLASPVATAPLPPQDERDFKSFAITKEFNEADISRLQSYTEIVIDSDITESQRVVLAQNPRVFANIHTLIYSPLLENDPLLNAITKDNFHSAKILSFVDLTLAHLPALQAYLNGTNLPQSLKIIECIHSDDSSFESEREQFKEEIKKMLSAITLPEGCHYEI